ncbi:hypothetical protein HF086_011162 [Spodoptera exigua]|uniref:C2H2-type domain-containing protein n=1 Tax=Spodoptera exigua TaxID=7107 RepID=A0A922MTP6_SPOEX|nr:hypothetical protein HF086_011162 [Spodoptera exigua]
MDDEDVQQFSLRWHNHQEVEAENNTLVVVLGCDAAELRLLLTFMYTGENSTLTPTEPEPLEDFNKTNIPESPVNLEIKNDVTPQVINDNSSSSSKLNYDDIISPTNEKEGSFAEFMGKSEKDRLSKLDQIVQNLYSTHKIGNPTATLVNSGAINQLSVTEIPEYDRKWRMNSSVCTICNKRLSNQYNLRVHMETHAGRRHACRACSHVSRSRDALRKHVAYRHAPPQHRAGRGDI